MENLKIHIGKRVKLLRKARKLSQEELAGRMERSVFTISQIERGQHLPKIDTLLDLAKNLNCDVNDIITHDPDGTNSLTRTPEHSNMLELIWADLSQMDMKTLKVAQSTISALANSNR